MRLAAILRRARTALARTARRLPSPYTLLDRLFAFRDRFRPADRWRVRPELRPLEPRLVPDGGRPLPLPVIYAGAGAGMPPVVRAYDAETGGLNFEREPYDPGFLGGVRVAADDFTGDGYPDLVAAPGPGGGPNIKVLDGHTGDPIPGPLGSFWAFDPSFTDGVNVAAGDVDGDGVPDVIAAAGPGGGPRVRVFSGATGQVLADFFALDPDFRGGISVAAADLTGDGKAEVAVGAGPGGGPRVRVYDPLTTAPLPGPLGSFYAFDQAGRGGVFVGASSLAGDVDADGVPDLAVGSGPGAAAEVRVFSGATGAVLRDITPFGPSFTGGVRVALAYVDDDPAADVVAGTGPGTPATVRVFSGATGAELLAPAGEYRPFGPAALGGVYVGAGNDPPPVVTLGTQTLSVGEGGEVGLWVYRSGDTTGGLSVDIGISPSDPTTQPVWGVDYTVSGSGASLDSGGGEVDFTAGESAVYLLIDAFKDNLVENPDEHFTISIRPSEIGTYQAGNTTSGTGGSGWDGASTDVTIIDDPAVVWLDPADQTLAEGGVAGGVTVHRSGGDDTQPVTAYFDIGPDDAPEADWDADYVMTGPTTGASTVDIGSGGGTVTFAPHEDAVFLTVKARLDNSAEGTEAFRIDVQGDPATPETYEAGFVGSDGSGGTTHSEYTADVTIADAPALAGELIIAARGKTFDGVVANVLGGIWTTTQLDAWIDWGDGDSSTGTLVGTGTGVEVHGQHSYARDGQYALSVRVTVTDTAYPAPANEAPGLAYVLATTDHRELQVVRTASDPTSRTLGETADGFTGTHTVSASAAGVGYTLAETIDEPDASVTLTRTGTFGFTLTETMTGGAQASTSLTLSVTESSTQDEAVAAPDRYGTASGGGGFSYSLAQTGTGGGGYGWSRSGGADSDRTETGTAAEGTYTVADSGTTSGLAASGYYSGDTGPYSMTWTGTENTWTHAEDGNTGPEEYHQTRTGASGSITGSETIGFGGTTFDGSEWHGGGYHLSVTRTFPGGGGGEEGGGTRDLVESGSGSEPGGTAGFGSNEIDSYAGAAHSTLDGVTTDADITSAGTAYWSQSGGLTAGATFAESSGSFETAIETASTDNQGVLSTTTTTATDSESDSVTGTLGAGSYTLTGSGYGTSTSTGTEENQGVAGTLGGDGTHTVTTTQTGDRFTGSYSLHQTDSSDGSGSDGASVGASVTGADGATGQRVLGLSDTGGGGGGSTTDRTGNLITGDYSLHQTGSSGDNDSPADTENTDSSGTGGSATETASDSSGNSSSGSFTLDRTGNALAGDYSFYQTSDSGGTAYDTQYDDLTAALLDAAFGFDNGGGGSTQYSSGTSTAYGTGNEVTGSYSLHGTSTSTGTVFQNSNDTATSTAADGATDGGSGSGTATTYESGSGTFDRTGNEADGSYSLHQTDTTTTTEYESDGGGGSALLEDGSSENDTESGGGTRYATGSSTVDQTGNEVTSSYSLFQTDTSDGTVYGSGSDGGGENLADGSSGSDSSGGTATAYDHQSSTATETGTEILGTYSVHESSSSTATAYDTGTDGGSDDMPDGSTGGGSGGGTATTYTTATDTDDENSNRYTGDYSLYQTSGSTVTGYGQANEGGSSTAADSGTDGGDGTTTATAYHTLSATTGETGNEITGTYSLYQSDTDTGTEIAVATAGGSVTAADTGTGDGSGTATVTTFSSDNSTSTQTGSELTGSYSLHETDGSTATAYESDAAGDEFAAADGEAGSDGAGDTATTYDADSTTIDRSGSETSGDYSLHQTDTSTATAYDVSTAGGTDTAADTSSDGGSATITAYSSESETEGLDRTFGGLTGSYSLHQTDNSTATASTTETDGGSAGFADGSSDGGGDTATGTSYSTDGTTLDRTGNETTGGYSLHETDTSTATEYGLGTDGGSVTLAGGSTDGGSGGGTGTVISVDTSTADRTGSDSTGAYSLHETGTDGGTVFLDGASDTESLTGADGATGTDGGGASGSEFDSDSYTLDETGNDATGTYSLHETGTDGSTAFETVAGTVGFTPPGGPADTEAGSLTATTFDSDTYTLDEGGDAAGSYSLTEVDSDSGTAYQAGGGGATVGADVDAASETATVYSSGHGTVTQTGDATGAYSLHRTDDSTATDFETGSERGQDGTSTSITTDSGTVDENGNGAAGDYTLTESGGGTTTLVHAEGVDARGTYTATGVSTFGDNGGDTGNDATDTGSPTAYQSGSSTVTIVGGDGTNEYTRTVTSTGGSNAPGGWDPTSGVATGTTTGSSTVTVSEYGTGAAGSYTLTDVETSSGSSAATTNLLTGAYTLTNDGTTGSSLHEEGWEGTAGNYTLDKTATGYDDSTITGDPRTGEYSLSGTFGSTSTATETNYHGSDSATFTEILTEDGTAAETGNGNTGDYSRHEWGTDSANFVQDGTSAPGSAHVTEGSSGSFDRTSLGNSGTGGYTLAESSTVGYSATETVSGSEAYTLTGTGSDTGTGTETGDSVTGGYTRTENGTDGYTLAETGSLTTGSVDETVTGTDSYGVSESGDHGKGTYDRTTTGGGGWTRTGDGASSGTNTYTQSLSGNDIAGHFSASETGTDRYGLVDRFADVSNTAPGTSTPGNVTLYSHGLPFRDPGGLIIDKSQRAYWEAIEQKVRETSTDKSFKFFYVPLADGKFLVTIPDADRKPGDVFFNIGHQLRLAGAWDDEWGKAVNAIYGRADRDQIASFGPDGKGFGITSAPRRLRPGEVDAPLRIAEKNPSGPAVGGRVTSMTAGGQPVYSGPLPKEPFKLPKVPGEDWMNERVCISPYTGEVISRLDFLNECFIPFMVPAPRGVGVPGGAVARSEGAAGAGMGRGTAPKVRQNPDNFAEFTDTPKNIPGAAAAEARAAARGTGTAPAPKNVSVPKNATNVVERTAQEVNAPFVEKGWKPPYAVDTPVQEFVTTEEIVFVRVHGEGNKARSWMMRASDIEGLTAAQIKDKFALPELPKFVSEVHVPAGTKVRVGAVAAQEGWGQGGATQYELLQRLPESAFSNTKPLQ